MMRFSSLAISPLLWASVSTMALAGTVTATKAWTLTAGLENPESARYCAETKSIYVSNVAGGATDKDGKGWITVVSTGGKVVKADWATGLNAPKGLACAAGSLWVADIDRLVQIALADGKVVQQFAAKDAKFLNDVAVDGRDVYVSDMLKGKIYKLGRKGLEVFVEGAALHHPNGLFVKEGALFVAAWGQDLGADFSTKQPGELLRLDLKTKKIQPLLPAFGNLDGLEFVQGLGWIVSDWVAGKVYVWDTKGKKPVEIIAGLQGAADIGYAPSDKLLLVPEMNKTGLHAYTLK